MNSDLQQLVRVAHQRAAEFARPFVIALDGRSGAGKTTLAARLGSALSALVIDGDSFFRGGVELRRDTPQERAQACIDWRLQRQVLAQLRDGHEAHYVGFDWNAFDGRLNAQPTWLSPRAFIILEGVYAARPELGDLVDLRVLLRVPDARRTARLLDRDGPPGPWERQWHEAEEFYFTTTAPEHTFDVVLER